MTYLSTCLADGAVGLWIMGESSTASPAADETGNQAGTYIDTGDLVAGQTGILGGNGKTAMKFIGQGFGVPAAPVVQIPSVAAQQLGDVFTFEVWAASLLGFSSVADYVLFTGSDPSFGGVPFFNISSDGSKSIAGTALGSALILTSTAPFPNDGFFHQCAWTKNGPANHLYIDGVDVSGAVTNFTFSTNTFGWTIGGYQFNDGNYYYSFDGIEQFAALYPTALSPTKIANHFTLGSTAFSNPVVPGPAMLGGRFHF